MRRDGQLALANIRGVDIAHWDPVRSTALWGGPSRRPRPLRNFGDLLGPTIVRAIARGLDLQPAPEPARLLAIGSIIHFAQPGDVVWGPGLNPKAGVELGSLVGLDVRAVRGPRTRELLARLAGVDAPAVYGDPGILLGGLRPGLVVAPDARHRAVSIVPNLNDLAAVTDRERIVNPRWRLGRVLRTIASSRLVVGTSLHGIIVAESLGVPARAVRTDIEGAVKYEDYYLATGRDPDNALATSVEDAIARGGAEPPAWDPRPLLDSFPVDLWGGAPSGFLEAVARRTESIVGRDAMRSH